MKSIVEYILESQISPIYEHVFNISSWSHRGAYDYPTMVIKQLLDGGKLILGKKGEGVDGIPYLELKDFDKEALKKILNNIDEEPDDKMVYKFQQSYNGNLKKSIWTNIYKAPFSGQKRKLGGGLEFESCLALNLQHLIINNSMSDDAKYKEVSQAFWNKIKDSETIKKLISMNLDSETVKKYVFVSGTGKTDRNALGQILNNDTFEVNVSKKITLTNKTENEVENVLTQSGKIIADVTITLDPEKFDKSDIKHINTSDIYISCKDGYSQFSGISMQQPFYGNSPKTTNKSYIIDCYNNHKSYEEFISDKNETCVKAFKNLCSLLGVNEKTVYDYFAKPTKERGSIQIDVKQKTDNKYNEVFAILIQLLIGGNYWYVNTSGEVAYVDDNIEQNKFTFIPSGKGHLDPKQIVVSGEMELPNNSTTKCELKFRNSAGGDYPYRLMVVPTDKHIISKLFA